MEADSLGTIWEHLKKSKRGNCLIVKQLPLLQVPSTPDFFESFYGRFGEALGYPGVCYRLLEMNICHIPIYDNPDWKTHRNSAQNLLYDRGMMVNPYE